MKQFLIWLVWAVVAGNVWESGYEGWVIGGIVFILIMGYNEIKKKQ